MGPFGTPFWAPWDPLWEVPLSPSTPLFRGVVCNTPHTIMGDVGTWGHPKWAPPSLRTRDVMWIGPAGPYPQTGKHVTRCALCAGPNGTPDGTPNGSFWDPKWVLLGPPFGTPQEVVRVGTRARSPGTPKWALLGPPFGPFGTPFGPFGSFGSSAAHR